MHLRLISGNSLMIAALIVFSLPGHSRADTGAKLVFRVGAGLVSPGGSIGSRYNSGGMLEGAAGVRIGRITALAQVSSASKMKTPGVLFGRARFSGILKTSGVGIAAMFAPQTSARISAFMLAGVGSYSVNASYSDATYEQEDSFSQTKPGFKIGIGLSYRFWRLASYLEADYVTIRTDKPVNLLEILLGLNFSPEI